MHVTNKQHYRQPLPGEGKGNEFFGDGNLLKEEALGHPEFVSRENVSEVKKRTQR